MFYATIIFLMKKRLLVIPIGALLIAGCATWGKLPVGESSVERLQALNQELDEAEITWEESIDDPWTEPELKRRYFRMQDFCRECARRKGGFATAREKNLCDRVRYPFEIYLNDLSLKANRLEEQLFWIDLTPPMHEGAPRGGADISDNEVERLRALSVKLEEAERRWSGAFDDPWTEPEFRRSYLRMQELCRECARREGGFASGEEKLCNRVRYPFFIYFSDLLVKLVKADKDKEQLYKPGTVAYEYASRPSSENLEKLRNVFEQYNRYYVGQPYTWTRHINKYRFQKSRLENFRRAFLNRDEEYLRIKEQPMASRHDLRLARRRAESAFSRLKKEYVTNDLPPAGEVNAFYMAKDLDDYHRLLEEERELNKKREGEGRGKEVVVFVHGLSETRSSWGKFPELLAHEDVVNPDIKDRYFKVYVFSYDTVEDSKSVEKFKIELAGFIKDIIRVENVKKVHLVGRSFGSVLSLKYIIHEADKYLEGVDMGNPERVAELLVKAYGDRKFRQTVKSFTSVAGSLSGSEIANIAGDRFIPEEQLFRKSLPLFRGGVPGYGDIQVRENQIGSEVNLNSFRRLDIECPLSPQQLIRFLPEGRGVAAPKSLVRQKIPVLCVIGDPIKLQSVFNKEGLLKMGELWKLLRFDGLKRIIRSYRREEDDGLVKGYSANINHTYLPTGGNDIGYKGADVRYTPHGHFSICNVNSRNHPAYRYVVSFLNGNLLPQMEPDRYSVKFFATLLRVFPDGVDPQRNPKMRFKPKENSFFVGGEKVVLPALRVEKVTDSRGSGGKGSHNVSLSRPQWNRMTDVHFCQGEVRDVTKPAWVTYRLRATGYRERLITMPVRAGEVSFAVNIVLQKE